MTSIPDLYSVGKAEHTKYGLLVVRWNCFAASIQGHQDYPYNIGVAIPFLKEDGAPNEPSLERLSEFEDTLIPLVQAGLAAIVAAVITTGRMREFLIYTGDPDLTMRRIESLRDRTTDMVVQRIVRRDPSWRLLRAFLPRDAKRSSSGE